MSDEAAKDGVGSTKRIEPEFWQDKRFFASPEALKHNPRRDNVAGWHSLEIIRHGGCAGVSYSDWRDNMPRNIVNSSGTNHHHLKWDLGRGHIRFELNTAQLEINDRVRGKGAPLPQKSRDASVMENVGSTTYALKIFRDIELVAFKLGRAESPKSRQDLFNLHSMPALGGLYYIIFLEYFWPNNEDAQRLENWLKNRFDAHRRDENAEIIVGVTEGQLRVAWREGIALIDANRSIPSSLD